MRDRATAGERRRTLSGDGFVHDATAEVMHAVTIAAPPEAVWPWLVQMGSGQAGWYSDDWVDNDGRPSATNIVPELRHLAVGDIMPSLPSASDSFVVAAIEPSRDLILTVPAANGSFLVSWQFFLEPIEGRGTRLLVRGRVGAQWPRRRRKTLALASPNRTCLCVACENAAEADGSCRRVWPWCNASAAIARDQAARGSHRPATV